MRTDAKIGFAIGGVLLAVLTVYAIVVPKHPKKTAGTVALVTAPTPPTGADTPAPLIGTSETSGQTQPQSGSARDTAVGSHVDPPASGSTVSQPGSGVATGNVTGNTATGGNAVGSSTAGNITPGSDLSGGAISVIKPDDLKTDGAPHDVGTHARPNKPRPTGNFEVADSASSGDRLYTIQSGQTLSKIAYEVYGNARFYVAILRENHGLDPNHLKVGSKIKLPDITPQAPESVVVSDEHPTPMVDPVPAVHVMVPTDGQTYTVKSGDNLYAIARRVLGSGRKADQIYALNKDLIGPDKSRLKLGMVLKLPESPRPVLAE